MAAVSREFAQAAYLAANALRESLAPDTAALLHAAYDLVLGGDVEAHPEDGIHGVYSPVERHTYIVTDADAADSTCTCQERLQPTCVHRLAALLYVQTSKPLTDTTAAIVEPWQPLGTVETPRLEEPFVLPDPPVPLPPRITQHAGRCMTEAPFSATVKTLTPKGFCWLVTVRGDHPGQFRADLLEMSAWLLAMGCQPILDRDAHRQRETLPHHEEPEGARPDRPDAEALPTPPADKMGADTRCPVHGVDMTTTDKGTSHKVADRKWCDGHWCQIHDERLWRKNGKHGTFYGHSLPDGSLCTGKAKSVH